MAVGGVADSYGGYRARLVEQLSAAGIRDLAVLRAFGETPRHLFVPEALRNRAYDDAALPIGSAQTISQPSTQARYLEALGLRGTERVLEIGTGSGYQTALLAYLAAHVISVERVRELAERAREALQRAGIAHVSVFVGDGSVGWRAYAPYDAIVVAAVSPQIPEPLIEQLAERGRMLIPIALGNTQELFRITKQGGSLVEESLGSANFVKLRGQHGFENAE